MTYPRSEQPRTNEALWLSLGYGSLAVLFFASLLAGQAGVTGFLLFVIVAAVIVVVLMPRSLPLTLARIIATLIVILLVLLLILTGLPLAIAELLSPIAQPIQDNGGDLGATVNLGWVGTVVVIFFFLTIMSVASYFSRSVPRILLSAFVLGVALFPLVGMLAQEAAR